MRGCRGLCDRERDAENGVGAKPALVGRAVERDQHLVDLDLRFSVHSADGVENLAIDGFNRFAHAFAAITCPAVTQLHGLVRAGRGAGRHRCAALGAVLEHDVDLDGRIAAAIENFAADDVDNGGHGLACSRLEHGE